MSLPDIYEEHLTKEIESLRAENVKLKADDEAWSKTSLVEIITERDALCAENARMREALHEFIGYQISDYDRRASLAKAYCDIRRRAIQLVGRPGPQTDSGR